MLIYFENLKDFQVLFNFNENPSKLGKNTRRKVENNTFFITVYSKDESHIFFQL